MPRRLNRGRRAGAIHPWHRLAYGGTAARCFWLLPLVLRPNRLGLGSDGCRSRRESGSTRSGLGGRFGRRFNARDWRWLDRIRLRTVRPFLPALGRFARLWCGRARFEFAAIPPSAATPAPASAPLGFGIGTASSGGLGRLSRSGLFVLLFVFARRCDVGLRGLIPLIALAPLAGS